MNNLEMTREEVKQTISEQTNEMSLQEVFGELRKMDGISNEIEGLHGKNDSEMKINKDRFWKINANEDLKETLGADSSFWATRMDSLRNSIKTLSNENDKVDFTLVRNYYDKVVDKFFFNIIPFVIAKEGSKR